MHTRLVPYFMVVLIFSLAPSLLPAADDYRLTVLITGSNRGIGFEFAKQYAAKGWRVLATTRHPVGADALRRLAVENHNVVIEQLDVTNEKHLHALVEKYRGQPIDLIINNAGAVAGSSFDQPLDAEGFQQVMAVNALAPVRISQALVDNVAISQRKQVAVISSGMGSVELAPEPKGLFEAYNYYAMSKAAVNLGMRRYSSWVRERGIQVAILSPGAVRTDMLADTGFDVSKANLPEVVVSALSIYLEGMTIEQNGSFHSYDGRTLPW
jgi:NAD(P)-dependent dehydrogenase (short-subunit alcohol dehydrogenase family)